MSSASADFNPYLKWLGIRSDAPNHYQLLGIEAYESDADVIVAAADRQMAHVRRYQNGPYSAQSQALLNELAAAKICLLNGDQKLAYDVGLAAAELPVAAALRPKQSRRWLALSSVPAIAAVLGVGWFVWDLRPEPDLPGKFASSESSQPAATTAADESTLADAKRPAGTDTSDHEGFSQSSRRRPTPTQDSEKPLDQPLDASNVQLVVGESVPQATENDAAIESPQSPTSTERRTGQTARTEADKQPGPGQKASSAEAAPLVEVIDVAPVSAGPEQAVSEAAPWTTAADGRRSPQRPFAGQQTPGALLLQSLHDRNLEAADKLLDQVRAAANDDPAREEALRIEIIYFKMKEFWDKVDQGLEKVVVGDTLNYRNVAVTVAAKAPVALRLQSVKGESRDFETARAKIDADLAVALARANGEASGIMLDVMCGVFLAIDRQGDLNAARDFLKRAKENGVPVELLLAMRPPTAEGSGASTDQTLTVQTLFANALTAGLDDVGSAGAGMGRERFAVPTPQVRGDKLKMLRREVYRDQFAKRGREAELQLANRLFQDANRSHDDPHARYVMYEQAIRLAVKHGDAKTADAAIRALVYNFRGDEDAIRLGSTLTLCQNLRDAEQARLALKAMQTRIRHLIETSDFAMALKYRPAADMAQSRSKLPTASGDLDRLEQRLSDLQAHWLQVRQQLMLSVAMPDDATLHTILGLYQLHQGLNDEARQHLQLGSHEGLARAAAAEQDMDGSAESQLAVADLWWQIAEENSAPSILPQLARQKAIDWYSRALDGLEGVSKLRAANRIRG